MLPLWVLLSRTVRSASSVWQARAGRRCLAVLSAGEGSVPGGHQAGCTARGPEGTSPAAVWPGGAPPPGSPPVDKPIGLALPLVGPACSASCAGVFSAPLFWFSAPFQLHPHPPMTRSPAHPQGLCLRRVPLSPPSQHWHRALSSLIGSAGSVRSCVTSSRTPYRALEVAESQSPAPAPRQ